MPVVDTRSKRSIYCTPQKDNGILMKKQIKWILIALVVFGAVALRETTDIISREEYKPDRAREVRVSFGDKAGAEKEELAEAVGLSLEEPGVDIAGADVNGDGRPDILVLDSNALTVFLAGEGREFSEGSRYEVGHAASSLAVSDHDGDGIVDALVGVTPFEIGEGEEKPDLAVLRGNGDGTFAAR